VFSERLRFLLNVMQGQQSGADDPLDGCREVDSEHGVREMACRMPPCHFPDRHSGAEIWLDSPTCDLVFDSITPFCLLYQARRPSIFEYISLLAKVGAFVSCKLGAKTITISFPFLYPSADRCNHLHLFR
jgi:hypothetical protein